MWVQHNLYVMVSINLSEVKSKEEIAKIIREKMEINGVSKNEMIIGTHLSASAINNVLCSGKTKDYRFSTLVKVLIFMKLQLYIGKNEEVRSKVLSLF